MSMKFNYKIGAFLIPFYFMVLVVFAQPEQRMVLGEQPIVKVPKTKETMTIDGKMDEAIWQKAKPRSFDSFYRVEKPDDEQNTVFKMVWDDQNLYLFYEFEDKYLTARETSWAIS